MRTRRRQSACIARAWRNHREELHTPSESSLKAVWYQPTRACPESVVCRTLMQVSLSTRSPCLVPRVQQGICDIADWDVQHVTATQLGKQRSPEPEVYVYSSPLWHCIIQGRSAIPLPASPSRSSLPQRLYQVRLHVWSGYVLHLTFSKVRIEQAERLK